MNSELTTNIADYIDHSRSSIYRASLSAQFASTLSIDRAAVAFTFTHEHWVQLWFLRARPMTAMASAASGMRVVYDKEGIDPYKCATHYGQRFHQRRRKRFAP